MSMLQEPGSHGFGTERGPSPYEDTLARRWQRRRVTLTVMAAVAGCILSLWLSQALRSRERNYAREIFKASVARWSDAFQRSMADRVGRVSTTAAFFRASDVNDRKDFHIFVSEITKNIQSIEVLAWAPHISAAQRNAHEEAVRKLGVPNYAIRQRDERGQFSTAGNHDDYYPILLAEPGPETQSMIGLDLGSGAVASAAMRQAKSTGHAVVAVYAAPASEKTDDNLLFVIEAAQYESVAARLTTRPPDQPQTDGFVLGVLRMELLAKRWLSLPGLDVPGGINVYISANGRNLAALSTGLRLEPIRDAGGAVASPPKESPANGAMAASEPFVIGGAKLKVVYVASERYFSSVGTRKPLIALLAGLFTTGLVVGYFWLLTGRMAAVERLVADRWLELRERERYIRHLVDNTGDAIFLCDQQGTILNVNRHACESLGYRRAELLSLTVADVELPDGADELRPLLKVATGDASKTFEAVHRRKDGTTFPVEVYTTSVGIGRQQLVLAIVRDVTDRKRAAGTLTN